MFDARELVGAGGRPGSGLSVDWSGLLIELAGREARQPSSDFWKRKPWSIAASRPIGGRGRGLLTAPAEPEHGMQNLLTTSAARAVSGQSAGQGFAGD